MPKATICWFTGLSGSGKNGHKGCTGVVGKYWVE